MAVAAEDERRASRGQRPSVGALPGGGSGPVLDAPVWEDDDDVCAGIARSGDVGTVAGGDQARAASPFGGGVVGRPDGVVPEQRDALPGDIEPRGGMGCGTIPARADVGDAQLIEVADRLDDATPASIADVVVGDGDGIDAGLRQAGQERRIEGEDQPVRMPVRSRRPQGPRG